MEKELFRETLDKIDNLETKNYHLERENEVLRGKLKYLEDLKKENKKLVDEIREKSIHKETMLEMYHNEVMLKAKKIKKLEKELEEYKKPPIDSDVNAQEV